MADAIRARYLEVLKMLTTDKPDAVFDQLLPNDPTCPLDWRARYLAHCGSDRSRRSLALEVDPVVATIRSGPPGGLVGAVPRAPATAILQASELADGSALRRAIVDAWLLAGETDEFIALRTGRAPDVVRQYADLYFDCRDHRDATHYLVTRLGECPESSPADIRWLIRRTGMFGGPAALQALLPSLVNFHEQAVTPLQLRTAGLPYGEELQAMLLVSGSAWAPPLVWLEISIELQHLPPDERDHRAPEVILRRLRAALHALDSAEEIADQQTATESDSILAALENRAKQPVVVSTLLEAIEPSAQEALPTRLDAAIVPCSTAS